MAEDDGKLRTFETGATRDTAQGKPDPEGYWSPLAMDRYDEYMLRHQVQADGSVRDSDNWQKGFGLPTLMKSLLRHVRAVWRLHRGWAKPNDDSIEDHLCGVIFNAQVYLHELLVKRYQGQRENDFDLVSELMRQADRGGLK